MSADSYGDKGQPQFNATGATAIDVDPSQVADYAALVGNHIVGTTLERNANVVPGPSGKPVWDGLYWSDSDDGITYKRVAGAWKPQLGDTGWITPTLGAGVTSDTANGQTIQYRRLNNEVVVHGRPLSATTTDAFTFPVGFRPSTEMYYFVGSGSSQTVSTRVVVRTNGTVSILAGTSPTLSPVRFPADQ